MVNGNYQEVFIGLFVNLTLAASFLIILGRSLNTAIKVVAGQAVLLAAVTAVMGYGSGSGEIYAAALLTVIVKAVVIPQILAQVVKRVGICREVKSYVNIKMSFVICTGLVIIAYSVTSKIIGPGLGFAGAALPAAISMVLIGLFVMITRKLAIMQIIGLIIMENGLFLAGIGTTHGMPLVVELGILLDILVGVLIAGILTFRISRTFDTIDTESLKNLRG